jgi:shikimate kinase
VARKVYLVGFMGAGKTSVGRKLARLIQADFFDLDREVERAERLAIPEIFERFGEARFRDLERQALKRTAAFPGPAVIALGGGAYVSPENRAIADAAGVTVWLKVSIENARARVKMDASRPLFQDREKAEQLYRERLPFYSLAQLHVSADGTPDTVVREIAAKLESHPS